jgi:predicted SnoaL-like aldol condensation-catalyzing enzyme
MSSANPGPADVHRRIVEAANTGRYEDGLALIDPEVLDHRGLGPGDHRGIAAWRDKWAHMNDGFHNASATIEHNVAAGDTSVNLYTLRATHTATGRSYEIQGLDMVRIRDGRLVEHWGFADWPAMRRQLDPDVSE